jgi:hypothetical protein
LLRADNHATELLLIIDRGVQDTSAGSFPLPTAVQPDDRSVPTAEDTWAFRQLNHHPVPTASLDQTRIRTPIDVFIVQKLQAKGLALAPLASRAALLRGHRMACSVCRRLP